LAEEFRQVTGIRPTVDIHLAKPVPVSVSRALYRIVQEALTNSSKYAEATQAQIHLVLGDVSSQDSIERLCLTIADNGRGFDGREEITGFGLRGMQERVAALDGEFRLTTAQGDGCQISVELPIP
jgi:signal transduction histidine kinase